MVGKEWNKKRRMVCFLYYQPLNETRKQLYDDGGGGRTVCVCVCVCVIAVGSNYGRHSLEPSWTPCVLILNDPVWLGCDCDYGVFCLVYFAIF